MKPITTTFLFILFISSISAQVVTIKSALQTDIAKVISDYPNGFKNISGEQVMENPQTIEFDCRISVRDAVKCRVIK